MNRFILKCLSFTLCVVMLCAVATGCNNTSPDDDTTAATTTAPRPTYELQDATGSVFIGSWKVTAQKAQITFLVFDENGSAVLSSNGNGLSGSFVVDGDQVTLRFAGSELVGTYVVDGDTITITTDDDVLKLMK